jgi:hypothetical protein
MGTLSQNVSAKVFHVVVASIAGNVNGVPSLKSTHVATAAQQARSRPSPSPTHMRWSRKPLMPSTTAPPTEAAMLFTFQPIQPGSARPSSAPAATPISVIIGRENRAPTSQRTAPKSVTISAAISAARPMSCGRSGSSCWTMGARTSNCRYRAAAANFLRRSGPFG